MVQRPLLNLSKILAAQPPLNVELLNIFLKFLSFAQDFQTHYNICSHVNIML